jgi:hypothetical protein
VENLPNFRQNWLSTVFQLVQFSKNLFKSENLAVSAAVIFFKTDFRHPHHFMLKHLGLSKEKVDDYVKKQNLRIKGYSR